MLFGVSNRGVSAIDAANPVILSAPAPEFAAAPASMPSEGQSSGGTSLILTGQNFSADSVVKMGTQLATNVNASATTAIQATSPASISNGPVNITAYSSSTNWLAIAPEAFSYGPKILRVLPNAGLNTGGDMVQIIGYGFGSDPGSVAVTIGVGAAIVQAVDNISAVAPALGLDTTYPFPLERITVQVPPGTSGWSRYKCQGSIRLHYRREIISIFGQCAIPFQAWLFPFFDIRSNASTGLSHQYRPCGSV